MQNCKPYFAQGDVFTRPSIISTGALNTFLQSNLPLIQKYLLSDKPNEILNTLEANTQPYFLLKLLDLSPNSQEFKQIQEKINKQGIEWINELFLLKIPQTIKNSDIPENQKIELLDKCREKLQLNFDRYIEPTSISVKKTLDNPNKLTSQILPIDFSISQYLKYNKNELYRTITRLGLKQFGVQNLLKLSPNQNQCRQILSSIGSSGEINGYDDHVIQILSHFFEITRNNYSFIEPYQCNLTLSQLNLLGKRIPEVLHKREYLKVLYQKTFQEKLRQFLTLTNSQLTEDQKKLKHSILIEAKKWLLSFNLPVLRPLIYYVNYEIISLEIQLKVYNLPLFFQYLDNPIESGNYFNQNQRDVQTKNKGKAQKDNYWRSLNQFQNCSFNTDSFVEQFILSYFQNVENPQIDLLYKYFDKKKIDEWYGTVRLARGDTLTAIGNIFDYNTLQVLRNQKHLSFVDNSKLYYRVDDPVILNLKTKNIEEITAEIYEINTEKHYLSSDNPINNHIAVDFIEPYKKISKTIALKNQFKHEESQFDFSNILENKNSIYIIDFVGAELYCRAVVRKGLIVCIEKSSIAGIELEFYEQNGVRINELDIWIENKKIPVREKYVIPYRQKEEIVKIVAVKNNFASMHKIRIPTEEYDFKLNYIFDKQNFIIGNKAKILLQARLELNGFPATMEIVKQTVITVNIVNNQGINTSFDLRNIKWNYKNEFQLEIPIQTPIAQIKVTLKTKVEKYKGEKKIEKVFTLNFNPEGSSQTISFFLTKNNDEYFIKALGLNAEPKPNLTANIVVQSLLFRGQQYQQFITDSNGEIKLGKLKNITKLSINALNSIEGQWDFSKSKQVHYSSKIIARVGEQIDLPIYSDFNLDHLEVLYYGQSNKLIKKITDNIVLKNQRLLIKLEQEGEYAINFLYLNKKITVLIRNGVFWQRTSQIYSKQKKQVLICYPQAHNYIGLSEKIDIKEQNNKYKVKCQLTSPQQINRQSIRVHVFASYFKYNHQIQKLRNNYIQNKQPIRVQVEIPKSNYLNNQCLSEQHCYILNRQKAKKYIGNSLQKPKILLNRTQTKETIDIKDQGGKPISYSQSNNASNPRSAMAMATRSPHRNLQHFFERVNSFNKFLKYNSLIIPNLNENQIEFQIPKHYKNIRILVTSQSFAIEKQFDLSNTNIQTKDLRHFGLNEKENNIGLTMSRNCYKVRKGQSLKINRNSVWAIISGQNIYSYSRTKNQLLKGWVLNWQSYDQQKKKEIYSKNICHEINTFIKYKDQEFFESVVRPFISNKLEKTVVDYCLLEDQNALKYLQINQLQLLNPFEKCLLIDYLVKNDKISEAQALTNSLKLTEKSKSTSFQKYQLLFDTAINCKLSEDNQELPSNAAMIQGQPNLFAQQQQIPQPYAHQYLNNNMNNMNVMNQPFAYQYAPVQQMYMSPEVLQINANAYSNQAYAPGGASLFGGVATTTSSNVGYSSFGSVPQVTDNRFLNRNMRSNAQVRVQQQAERNIQLRNQYKKGFTEIQKTKEYTETTYQGMKNPLQSTNHVQLSQFWVDLAEFFLENNNKKQQFLSQNFIYLNSRVQFTLAFCFISNSFNSKYSLKSQQDSIIVTAQTSFLVFVKQVKNVEYKKRSDIIITQHFYDPQDEFVMNEDGQRIEKTISQFVKDKYYCVKTIITNISQNNLQLQILMDIPSGSIPIDSDEYTQIKNQLISSYSIRSYSSKFYFPQSGTFKIYPSNVSKKGEVIAKAASFGDIIVKDELVLENLNVNNLQSILTSGTLKDVLNFVKEKNIFDRKIFNFDAIMWMLKDKQFFKSIVQILKSRLYYNQQIWSFSLLHNDLGIINEYLQNLNEFKSKLNNLSIFEYYPLSSKRVHKHLKGFKNQILNQSFKVTYESFLLSSIFQNDRNNPVFILVFTYYLILQDRIEQAVLVFNRFKSITKSSDFPGIQYDYISCFLDIYTGYPNFVVARQVSAKYKNYPIEHWRQIFRDIDNLLNNHDTFIYQQDEVREYEIKFINKGNNLRILLPEKTSLELNLFAINLELFFSSTPFDDKNIVISVQPFKVIKVESKNGGEEKIEKPDEYSDIYVIPTETSATKSGQVLAPFLWNNDSVKVKLLEDNGVAIVFVDGKPKPGTYCKVYAKSNTGSIDFYKDGYTDLQGKFAYAASQLSAIDKFAILFKTDKGGVIKQARKPNSGGVFEV